MYRILNPTEEPQGQILTSNMESQFRKDICAYRTLSHDIYVFAQKTGLQIQNAIKTAVCVPAYGDILSEFFSSKSPKFDLYLMAIDDPIRHVSTEILCDFVCSYIKHVKDTGLCYDFGKEHLIWEFIWEMIRYNEFPEKPSRMNLLFLFNNEENAIKFKKEWRNDGRLVKVNLLGGNMQYFDMNWFTDVPCDVPLSEVQEYARNYWKHVHTEKPVIEVLYQGYYSW